MNPWIVLAWMVTIGSVAGLAAALAWISFHSHRPGSQERREGRGGDAASTFSLARYQVMERLLSSQDVRFLAAHRGIHPRLAARWKRDSLRIFRLYLGELTRDFLSLHAHARRLVVESHSESRKFAATLVRQQAAFWRARMILEGRLLLFRFGFGSVDVKPFLGMIEAMRIDLDRVVPEPAQAL